MSKVIDSGASATIIDTLSFNEAVDAIIAAMKADVTVGMEGNPGVGKTSIGWEVSRRVQKPLYILIGSNCEPTDVAGLPVVINGQLMRIPLPQIRACATEPGLFFLDEMTGVPRSVQQPLMRGLLEKVFGDIVLHKESYVFGAWNPPGQTSAGQHLSAATGSRLVQFKVSPTLDEICEYFKHLGEREAQAGDLAAKELLGEAREFAATLMAQPGLLTLVPPKVSLETGAPWASPRSWERGLRVYTAAGGQKDSKICRALIAGAVGKLQAAAYLAIKDMRQHLPSKQEILRDPYRAHLSNDQQHQIAAVGLLSRVADDDAAAAWIYASRLIPELGTAVAYSLAGRPDASFSDNYGSKAYEVMERMLASVTMRQRRTGV